MNVEVSVSRTGRGLETDGLTQAGGEREREREREGEGEGEGESSGGEKDRDIITTFSPTVK